MGPWQTGKEEVWNLAEKVGNLGGGSGVVRKDPGLKTRGREPMGKNGKKECEQYWSERRKIKSYNGVTTADLVINLTLCLQRAPPPHKYASVGISNTFGRAGMSE